MSPKAELINYFADKIVKGEMEFDQVRKELEARGMSEEDIRVIVMLVDTDVQRGVRHQSDPDDGLLMWWLAVVLIALFATASIVFGIFKSANTYMIVMALDVIGGGIVGFRQLNRRRPARMGQGLRARKGV